MVSSIGHKQKLIFLIGVINSSKLLFRPTKIRHVSYENFTSGELLHFVSMDHPSICQHPSRVYWVWLQMS